MATFQTVRNRILSDLNRTDLTATVETEIRTAIAFYEKRPFWFLEGRSEALTEVGQEFMELPEDFRAIDSLKMTSNGYTWVLNYRTNDILDQWAFSATTGQPTDFSIYDQQIRYYPIPGAQYQVEMAYYRQEADLQGESDSNAWTDEGESLIRARVCWNIFARKLRDQEGAIGAKAIMDEELAEHLRITNARLMTGHTRRRKM